MEKQMRDKGKIPLSKYFQRFEKGDFVAVVVDPAVPWSFPKRLQGKTGVIDKRRGKSYEVLIKDQAKSKRFLIAPIHLKKIKKD